ncbi:MULTISPECIES: ethanolamine utilization phosphate acetyltransferase EutD [unclassified Granulicatella]|uniref:ethanolamine utilization phosphate acetyltransferase EutD n=1 Tax=unclassified Granulicatella TaxID=2630493 RepID=UPI00107373A0|nr:MULTISPECIES: ethanolamine utilization phosphate acetyltransferase EutD [unclassified Granulicatella]MBF0780126.1 phosphate propanoyltransferase [Granulicatella sp. 19428wC4_WM01]TFU95792.1 phosphate propanoyltransferase [Granulicatella sp. WM01]
MASIDELISKVLEKVQNEVSNSFEVEASGRHIHLSQADVDTLFGKGYELTKQKDLSQPGQYACKERITVLGPKGAFHNVVILGPVRPESQVEISLTDGLALGVKAPIRESGDIEGTPGIVLVNGNNVVSLEKGLIVAKRHIHMSPDDARKAGVENKEIVQVKVEGARPLIFDDVVVRVHPNFATAMHIDYDEANACGFTKGMRGRIIKKS